jgi:hypothetical protein
MELDTEFVQEYLYIQKYPTEPYTENVVIKKSDRGVAIIDIITDDE